MMNRYRKSDFVTPRTLNEAFGEPWCVQVYKKPFSVARWLLLAFAGAMILGSLLGACHA